MALREWWTRLGLQSRSTNRQWRCRVSAPPPVSSWPVVQTGKNGCPLGLFRRPRRLRFPNKGFIVHLWPVRIAVAVTLLESSDLQSLEVFSERVANQRRAIPLGTMRGPIGRLSELRIENNLDRFHMWNLLHSILHTHGTGGFVPAARPAFASGFHPAHPWQPRQEAGNIIDYDPPHRLSTFRHDAASRRRAPPRQQERSMGARRQPVELVSARPIHRHPGRHERHRLHRHPHDAVPADPEYLQ